MAHAKTCAIFVFPAGVVDYAAAECGIKPGRREFTQLLAQAHDFIV